jgi:hypothetical protein
MNREVTARCSEGYPCLREAELSARRTAAPLGTITIGFESPHDKKISKEEATHIRYIHNVMCVGG